MRTILAVLMVLVGIPSFLALVWAGFTRCKKCQGWCVDSEDCEERRLK